MQKKHYLWLLYNLLAIISGIIAYRFFSEGKWFNTLLLYYS
jgi:hypothetical protein